MKHMFSDVTPFRRNPLDFLAQFETCDEPLVPLALGPRPVLLLTDPAFVKRILKTPEQEVNKGRLIRTLRSVIGDSVVILNGAEHRRRRKVLHPFLSRSGAERMAPTFLAEIRRSAAMVARDTDFDADLFGAALALRLVSIAVFGHRVLSSGDEQSLVQAVRLIEDDVADEIFRTLPAMPWTAWAQRRRRRAAREAMQLIVARVRGSTGETSAMQALAALDLDDTATANEVLTLLLAGHHTTGAAVAWMLHALATQPGLARALAAEARAITSSTGELDIAQLATAVKSLAAAREILRLYPSSWWFSREVQQPIEIGGRKLKPGTSILISPWLFHRSARHWDAPDEFRLDRGYNTPAYCPFGAGPRACVGMGLALLELQLIALEMAASFELSVLPGQNLRPNPMVMLMPPRIRMRARPRDSATANGICAA
ncbi:cytochrome P450 [Stappia sp.]|uniref:cytochrome P450 n=1 Tax=Stappia sp. TaxID=1870903 RepID=UPI0032D8FE19